MFPLREQLRGALSTIEQLRQNDVLRAETVADEGLPFEARLKAELLTTGQPPSSDPIRHRREKAERRAEARAEERGGKAAPVPRANLQRRRRRRGRARHCRVRTDLAVPRLYQHARAPGGRPAPGRACRDRPRCLSPALACGAETMGDFPPTGAGVFGPVQGFSHLPARPPAPAGGARAGELLEDLLGVKDSLPAGSACTAEAAGRLAPFLAWLRDRLRESRSSMPTVPGTAVGTTRALGAHPHDQSS